MSDIILSIIIPVYNVEKYLRECLDSVFSQYKKKYEIICVNDGSIDQSRVILQEYKNIHKDLIIVDRENGGLSAARNSGLDKAKGDFVFFLDSDDYLLSYGLPRAIDLVIKENLDIGCFNASVGADRSFIDNKGSLTEVKSGQAYYSDIYSLTGNFPPSPVWLHIYKKSFLEEKKLRFKEGIFHEDEEFSPRAFYLAERVKYFNLPVVFYRVREGAITFNIKEKNLLDFATVCRELFKFYQLHNCANPLFYQKVFDLYFTVIIHIDRNKWHKMKIPILSKDDFKIMRHCVLNLEAYKIYWYYSNNKIAGSWIFNKNFILIKKVINQILKFIYTVLLQKRNLSLKQKTFNYTSRNLKL